MRLFDPSYVWGQSSVSTVYTNLLQRQRDCMDKTVLFDSLGLRINDAMSFTYNANAQPA